MKPRRRAFLLPAVLAALLALPAPAMRPRDGYRLSPAVAAGRGGSNPAPRAIPVNPKARVFLLRWNPAVSSCTPDEFADAVAFYRENGRDGFN